jgi:integrase
MFIDNEYALAGKGLTMNLDTWKVDVLARIPIRAKTLATYNSAYRCHVHDAIGHLEIEDITRSDIQKIIQFLPPQIGATTLALLKTLYREAIIAELVLVSPADKVAHLPIQVEERAFLPYQELELCDFGKFRTQILFLAAHGLRWSEAVALTASDIHDGRVHITKSAHGMTKSAAGVRTVPYVTDFERFPRSPKALRKILAKSGVHIHSLRHTYAYLLKTSGVHVTTAQKLMGHSDPKVTLGIYTRFRDVEIDQAGDLIKLELAGHAGSA